MKNKNAKKGVLCTPYPFAILVLFLAVLLSAVIGVVSRSYYGFIIPFALFASLFSILFNRFMNGYRLMTLAYAGDATTVTATLTDTVLQETKSTKRKIHYLLFLCMVYHDSGDMEKLEEILGKLTVCTNGFSAEKLAKNYPVISYYRNLLAGHYEACLQDFTKTEAIVQKNPVSRARRYYTRGLVYYKMGKTEEAKKEFSSLIAMDVKLYICEMAKAYIDHIDNHVPVSVPAPLINGGVSLFTVSGAKKSRTWLRILRTAAIVILVIALLLHVQSMLRKQPLEEYEQNIYGALDGIYEEYELASYITVYEGDIVVDTVCAVMVEDRVDMLSFVQYTTEDTYGCIPYHTDMQNGETYWVKAACTDYCYKVCIKDVAEGDYYLPLTYERGLPPFFVLYQHQYICITDIMTVDEWNALSPT